MKKIVFGDFAEYNYPTAKFGNYHICNQFVKNGYEALWVSNVFNELICLKDKADYDCKRAIAKPIRNQLAENIYGFAPWSWRLYGNYPFCRDPGIIENMPRTIRPDVKVSMKEMDFYRVDVLWISNPKLFWLADVIAHERLVYRIADDYARFREYPNIEILEKGFIRRAGHVFITSDLFEEKVLRLGTKPIMLRNAVDLDFFSEEQALPEEYKKNTRKRVLYVGTIHYWFDVDLVARLARAVDADVYLIGKEIQNLDVLRSYSNVHILGARDFSSIPAYMQHADVSVIPFVRGELTAAISPLKLFEYCASGTPVVSTYMEEVARMEAPVYIARDHADFIEGVRKALENPGSSSILKEYAAQNSWKNRFRIIMEEFGQYV